MARGLAALTFVLVGCDAVTESAADSCYVSDWGICYEVAGYDATETWCNGLASKYAVAAQYADEPCSGDVVGTSCDLASGSGEDFTDHAATAYYDSASFDDTSAASSCEQGGGTPNSTASDTGSTG